MQKTVLSLSVAAALAVPTLAMAQDKPAAGPAAPTLDKVFEASGISATGYIDAAYTHANRDIEMGFSDRVNDSLNNSFSLQQVGLQIAKQPKQGFGGLVNVTAGHVAQVIHSLPEGSSAQPNGSSSFDLTQAYAQYAGGPLTIIGGKFTTLHGTEVIWSPSNANFSRSILFGAVPFTHTGVRATYAPSDTLSLIAGLNNGWDQRTDTNKGKTLELGVTATPIKPLSLAASYYGGKEFAGGTVTSPNSAFGTTGLEGRRDSFNVVGSYNVIEPLTLGLEYLTVKQKDAVFDTSGNTKDGKYWGLAGYVTYVFMPKFKATLRAETFDDKDGFRFPGAVAVANSGAGVTGVTGTKLKEYTLTLTYPAADNFELRGEVRYDKSNEAVFKSGINATDLSKSLTTYAVQALYKF